MTPVWRVRLVNSALPVFYLFAAVVVGPTAAVQATPEPGIGQSAEADPSQPESAPRLDWGSCAPFIGKTDGLPTARCTKVPVPVDYDRPGGQQAQLAVLKIPASGPRMGSLLINPGGPGASAVDTVADLGPSLANTVIGKHFDLVGFDPRGVGYSVPELRCRTDAEFDAFRREPMVDFSAAGVAHIEDLYRQLADGCADRMGADFLRNVGTESAAHDMDMVRAALGEQQINYLGFSYGTELGTAYVERFGDHARAMVLDGAIDPSADAVEQNINQMAGFQVAFNDYAADCARSPACPLGTDPAQAVDRFHRLVDPLVDNPAKTKDPRGLGYADAVTGTIHALYAPQYWKYLNDGLLGLQRGTDPGALLALADDYQDRDTAGRYANTQDAFNAIRCVDAPSPKDSAAWVDADRRIRQAAPFLSYGTFTGNAPRDLCALWPVPATTQPGAAAAVAPGKVVVVSTTRDPATPYQAGISLANQLGAPLITYDGTQHTAVFNGDRCVDGAVVRYFIEGTPPGNLRC
jgi:pimeloyl-ACP methyl ester carboxylesterase